MAENRSPRRIQSVRQAFEIIEALRDGNGLTLTEVAETVDLSVGTLHTYLATMEEMGYVRSVDGEYRVGLNMVQLGKYVQTHSELYQAAKSELVELAEERGKVSHLLVQSNGRGITLYERFGPDTVAEELYTTANGYPRQNLHSSSAGKAVLAHLPEDRREEILEDYDYPAWTPATITDEATLREELEQICEQGYAVNDEEQIEGVRAVGAPVLVDDTVKGAISLSSAKSRMVGERFTDTIPNRVIQATERVAKNLESPRSRTDG